MMGDTRGSIEASIKSIWVLVVSQHGTIEEAHGAKVCPLISPEAHDFVFPKKRPSAFFCTPLELYLRDRLIDTPIIAGGSVAQQRAQPFLTEPLTVSGLYLQKMH